MTGCQEFFADLNTDVRGTVRFGDASKVEIKGVGFFMASISFRR
jgi:hypothetical protein